MERVGGVCTAVTSATLDHAPPGEGTPTRRSMALEHPPAVVPDPPRTSGPSGNRPQPPTSSPLPPPRPSTTRQDPPPDHGLGSPAQHMICTGADPGARAQGQHPTPKVRPFFV